MALYCAFKLPLSVTWQYHKVAMKLAIKNNKAMVLYGRQSASYNST